jgi:DNA polymerase I-like protein with 3'-5' exonuclease and polymerase domains
MLVKQRVADEGHRNWLGVDSAISLFTETQRVLAGIEANGIKVDMAVLEQNTKAVDAIIADLEQKIAVTDVGRRWQQIIKHPSWSNRNEVAKVLFIDKRGFQITETVQTQSGAIDLSDDILQRLAWKRPDVKDFIHLYSEYQSMLKLQGTYLDGMRPLIDCNGFIHPSFGLLGVRTYRTCLAGDTKIMVCSYDRGGEFVRKRRIDEIVPGDFVYCINQYMEPTVGKVKRQWKTGHRSIIRLHYILHSGERAYLDCTPDHKIRMADGEYCNAKDLLAYKSSDFKPNSPFHRYVMSAHINYPKSYKSRSKCNNNEPPPPLVETSNYEILEIEDLGIEADVYDIEVEGFHNFIANELCVHNSSHSPNIQNIPNRDDVVVKYVRTIFVPREKDRHFVEVDYSGIEVRTNASINNDPTLVKSITEGLDFHKWVAEKIYLLDEDEVTKPIRNSVKGDFTFAAFYGSYWKQMALKLWDTIATGGLVLKDGTPLIGHLRRKGIDRLENGNPPQKGGYEYLIQQVEKEFWNDLFKVYAEWKKEIAKQASQYGFVDTPDGFRVAGILDKKSATNSPAQCSASHCLLLAMCGVVNDLERLRNSDGSKMFPRSLVIGEIHDSIMADVPNDELNLFLQLCHYWMTVRVPAVYKWLTVPLDVEADVAPVGESWAKKKGYKIDTDYDSAIFG